MPKTISGIRVPDSKRPPTAAAAAAYKRKSFTHTSTYPTVGGRGACKRWNNNNNKQNLDFLRSLSNCLAVDCQSGGKKGKQKKEEKEYKSRVYRELIGGASERQLLCLVECALNILRNRRISPIIGPHIHALRKQAHAIRALSRARSAKRARQILSSGGGGAAAEENSTHITSNKRSRRQQTGRGIVPVLLGSLLANVVLPLLADQVKSAATHS